MTEYPLLIITGAPLRERTFLQDYEQQVPCPGCLKPMILNIHQFTTIFFRYFIDDNNEDLDVMCIECKEKAQDETD